MLAGVGITTKKQAWLTQCVTQFLSVCLSVLKAACSTAYGFRPRCQFVNWVKDMDFDNLKLGEYKKPISVWQSIIFFAWGYVEVQVTNMEFKASEDSCCMIYLFSDL